MTSAAAGVLARHGRSFHLAARLLPTPVRSDCARLYRFCRFVDDIADSTPDPSRARAALERIDRELLSGSSADPVVADFLELVRTRGVRLEPARELLGALREDVGPVRVRDGGQLVRYAYRVAGTVGLMMADLLGASSRAADAHAIDLGIAMQLTNVARDVAEDARRGRCYLPADRLGPVTVGQIAGGALEARPAIRAAVGEVLDLADVHYASGEEGLAFLPPRAHLSILVAARVYREIGHELRRRQLRAWEGRTVVSLPRKLSTAARALGAYAAGMRGAREGAA
jgi:phytoene synthase